MAELVRGPIDAARLLGESSRPDCGAIALFLGTARDHHEGRRVTRLFYEAYEPMALAALQSLEQQTLERFGVASCRIVHRVGEVPIGEASVAVLVASPHRAPAFDACRWARDELKRTAPIWKQESYAEGGSRWVEGTEMG